jgi:mono/diheme cytochrome c family protein
MKGTSRKRTSPKAQKQRPRWPTSAQALRQLGIVAAVVLIWAALLAGYLSLTGKSAKPTAGPAQPTQPAATTQVTATTGVSFSKDVLPLFKTNCESCHGSGQSQAGLKLTAYADVMAGSARGPVVVPGNAASSRLVELVTAGQMPPGGSKLSASEIEIIRSWVDAGAPDN